MSRTEMPKTVPSAAPGSATATDPSLHVPPAPSASRGILPPGLLWAGAGVLAVVLAGAGYLALRSDKAEGAHEQPAGEEEGINAANGSVEVKPGAPQWRYVDIQEAKAGSALAPLPSPGRVTFDESRTSAIGTPLPGRVEQVLVRLGDRVSQGVRLFAVRSGALADVGKEVENAQRDVQVKKRIAERTKELVELHTAPEKDLLAAEADLKSAETSLKAATSRRESLKVSEDGSNLFWVTAPRDGTVVDLDVFPGQQVDPGRDKPLVQLSDLGEVIVIADVQERDANDLTTGEPVEIRARAGTMTRKGVVERVSEVLDPLRRTLQVRIRAKNADRALRPNAYVEVALNAAPADRVRVPSEAVVTDGSRAVMFLANDQGKLVRTPVTTGRERDGEIEILAGLQPGQRYVGRGALLMLNQINLSAQ